MIIRPYIIAGRGAVFVGWAKPDRSSFRREAPLLRAGEHSSPLHCFTKGWEKGHSLEKFD
ncbi:MAG: hypothetical protein LBS70_09355 [Candidatus Accumulibacter sp.]|jgi:hypothetical protein|nr:hypothetical protein [Accumulibacter sp.]